MLGSVLALAIPRCSPAGFFPSRCTSARRIGSSVSLSRCSGTSYRGQRCGCALRTLGPADRLHPRFVRVPVALQDDFALTALASTISLTPGTVSAQISTDRQAIIVHSLDVTDEEDLIGTIKSRYEAPIKEIFKC